MPQARIRDTDVPIGRIRNTDFPTARSSAVYATQLAVTGAKTWGGKGYPIGLLLSLTTDRSYSFGGTQTGFQDVLSPTARIRNTD